MLLRTGQSIGHNRAGLYAITLSVDHGHVHEISARAVMHTVLTANVRAQCLQAHAMSGALVVGLHHVLGEALEQRRTRASRADAPRAALDAQVLQHQRLQLVRDLRHRLGGLRTAHTS